jgi:hypothetical protein
MHGPDHGPDHSRRGALSIKQLGGEHRAPVRLTTHDEFASHERSVRCQCELVGVRMGDLPADYVVGGAERAKPKSQYMPVDP